MKTKFDKYDKFKTSQAHIRYMKKDKNVPGITTVTKSLADTEPIAIWANNLGLANINMVEYRRELAQIGTLWHEMIQCLLMNDQLITREYTQRQIDIASRLMDKFKRWRVDHKIEPVAMELPLVSLEHNYGGTGDFFGYIDNVMTYMDFKSTDSIKMEHHVQGVACMNLWNEHNPEQQVTQVCILRASRDADMTVEYSKVGNIEKKFELFLHLLKTRQLINEIKGEEV